MGFVVTTAYLTTGQNIGPMFVPMDYLLNFQCLQFGPDRILPRRQPTRAVELAGYGVLFHAFVNQNGRLLYCFKVASLMMCVYSG